LILFGILRALKVGFFEGHKVLRVSLAGGNAVTLGTLPQVAGGTTSGGTWLRDQIILATGSSGLLAVPLQGGKVTTSSRRGGRRK
jgi:hypothetical protein